MKAKLARILDSFLRSGFKGELDPQLYTRLVFFNSTSLFAIFVVLYFLLKESSHPSVLFPILLSQLVVFPLLIIVLRVTKRFDLIVTTVLFFVTLTFLSSLFTGGNNNSGLLWFSIFPVSAFFLRGRRQGMVWAITFILVSWFLVRVSQMGFYKIAFNYQTFSQAMVSQGALTILMYFYESISEQYFKLVNKQKNDLTSLTEQLRSEVDQRKDSQIALEKSLTQIEEQNKNLLETKRAILNVLDDEKELQNQLKKEKANVEQTVNERTVELKQESIELAEANKTIEESILKIQEEKSRLDASINGLPLGFIMTDVNNYVLAINHRAKEILGLKKQIIQIDQVEAIVKGSFSIIELSKKARISKLPEELKQVDFGKSVFHVFVSPIIALAKEEFLGSVILIEDITEQVVQTRSKDEFFSIASHELRTPLTAIRSYTALIRDDFSQKINSPDFDQMISNVHESSLRLIQIVNDFLDVSKLEQHKIPFRLEKLLISDIVTDVYKNVGALAQENKLKMILRDPARTVVLADKERIKQILFNLIGNGIKFTKKGSISVVISKDKTFAKIAVSDTGKGVPLANQKLLFKKFQQAEGSLLTRESNRATGLGLYISKLLVEAMGGEIKLEKTQVNKGTTFVFTLPLG